MKVIIIANTYWNIVNFRQPIIDMLKQKGAKIYISAPFDVSAADIHRDDADFIGLKYGNGDQNGLLNAYKSIQEFKQIFSIHKPDLVLLYTMKPNIFGNIAAAQLNIPVISTVTGLGYTFIKGGLTRFLSERLYKFAFRKTKHIIFHNPDDKQLFVNQGFAKEDRCKVIRGSGVDIVKFKPQIKSKKSDKFIFIFVGRLLIDKGIREYIEAAKHLEYYGEIEFHIVGGLYPQNPAAISQERWSELEKSSDSIVWHKKQDDVRPFLAAANCMVLPSYREGLPMSILEAMAMGLPIITTDVPGCRETVENYKNGMLVPPQDVGSLVFAMMQMYDLHLKDYAHFGTRSREKAVEEFSTETVTLAYKELIFQEGNRQNTNDFV